jgi:hypothetical protein
MRSVLLNVVGGLFCAAWLLAGLPSAAMDLPEEEELADPEGTGSGSVIWQRQLGTRFFEDYAIGVATDAAGNVLIGASLSYRTFGVKYSPAGKRLSTRQLSVDPSYDTSAMAWDSAGNFLIASSVGIDLYDLDGFVFKYSAAGKRLWTRRHDYGANDVAADAAGNVLIGGQTNYPGECCNSEAFAAKYSPAGKLLWTRTLAGWDYFDTEHVVGNAVATDAAGDVFIGGYTFKIYPEYIRFAFVAKYNSDVKFLWTRKLALGDNTLGEAVATDAAGNVLIGGSTGPLGGPLDAVVAKYSPAGKRLWMRQFGTPEDDGASGIATDAAGNVVIGGTTWGSLGGPNQGFDDAFVAKYSPAGKRLWTRQFGTPEGDGASGIATDAAGNVVIEGTTAGSLGGPNHGGGDVFIVKLRP